MKRVIQAGTSSGASRSLIASGVISSAEHMRRLGLSLGQRCEPRDCLLLMGDLGAGKTTLVRGIVEGLGGNTQTVQSPTFALLHTYPVCKFPASAVWHFDFYRLKQEQEVRETGLEEALADGITLIEWPETVLRWLPANALMVEISYEGEEKRRVTMFGNHEWKERCKNLLSAI